ncbi:MarR family transcriptional regulator [Actinopolymorpha sp. NPDC004070]|uniref:MarR family transcriptional regulator n=1 Tax=Actinopolymorpha sp. NPDC004070 TaxID=3154548 RepID=UPI0033A26B26
MVRYLVRLGEHRCMHTQVSRFEVTPGAAVCEPPELRVSELAQRVGLNQSSETRLVSRLEAKNLVRRSGGRRVGTDARTGRAAGAGRTYSVPRASGVQRRAVVLARAGAVAFRHRSRGGVR